MADSTNPDSTQNVGGNQVDKPGEYGVRITIPDKPLKEQLRMVKDMRQVMLTFAKVAGEEDQIDLSQFDEAIKKLKADIAVSDMKLNDPEADTDVTSKAQSRGDTT